MAEASPPIHLTTYGYTFEGRPMPLAVIGAPDATPATVLATGKNSESSSRATSTPVRSRVRKLCSGCPFAGRGERASWLKDVVLLIAPIYNADGNERVIVRNRGAQHGPVGGMGQRHNAQDLDLNRDGTKLETPEARSMAQLLTQYDPHVAIDLHTTNGTDHGFHLTYEIGLNPNTSPGITNLLRDDLLPSVTIAVKAKHGWDYCYYGARRHAEGERAVRRPRPVKPRYRPPTSASAIIGTLETYSARRSRTRIKSRYHSFLEEILNFTSKNGRAVRWAVATTHAGSIIGTQRMVRGKLVKLPALVRNGARRRGEQAEPVRSRPADAPPGERQRACGDDATSRNRRDRGDECSPPGLQ